LLMVSTMVKPWLVLWSSAGMCFFLSYGFPPSRE
jgi:hypothetical protein